MPVEDIRFRRAYETSRLYLKILDESNADIVLAFLNKGASVFEEFESAKPSDYYTHYTQKKILRMELDLANQKKGVRFYIFRKENPREIIGTISVSSIRPAPFESAMIGYKFHSDYWHHGYATEALRKVMEIVGPVLSIRRLEAFVLPDNSASCRLLTRVGFHLEGTALSSLEVKGVRRDHLQYSYIIPKE